MFVEDFSFNKDDNGIGYVTYEENPTKLTRADFARNNESFSQKCLPLVAQDVQSNTHEIFPSTQVRRHEEQWSILSRREVTSVVQGAENGNPLH